MATRTSNAFPNKSLNLQSHQLPKMNNDQLRRFIGQDFYSDQSAATTKKVGYKLYYRVHDKLNLPISNQLHILIQLLNPQAIQSQK